MPNADGDRSRKDYQAPPPSCDELGCDRKPVWETTRSDQKSKGSKRWCSDHFQEKMGRYPLEDMKRVEL